MISVVISLERPQEIFFVYCFIYKKNVPLHTSWMFSREASPETLIKTSFFQTYVIFILCER